MAVLADYPPEEAEQVLRTIVENLKRIVKNKRVLKKYINQLMMLSRLRKIELLTIKITEDMPIHYDFEADTLYVRGEKKGRSEERKERIIKFWKKGVELPMISNLMDMPVEDIERIIAEYRKVNNV